MAANTTERETSRHCRHFVPHDDIIKPPDEIVLEKENWNTIKSLEQTTNTLQ